MADQIIRSPNMEVGLAEIVDECSRRVLGPSIEAHSWAQLVLLTLFDGHLVALQRNNDEGRRFGRTECGRMSEDLG